jgi:hypothetical protein
MENGEGDTLKCFEKDMPVNSVGPQYRVLIAQHRVVLMCSTFLFNQENCELIVPRLRSASTVLFFFILH